MKKIHGFLPRASRGLAVLTALAAVFAQMAPAQTTWYVATNGTGNGTSWADATNSLQGAINAISSSNPTNTVWVSNGVYEAGGVTNYPTGTVLTNRVAIWKAITVRSANNDPTNTIIKGAWDPTTTNGPAAVRCLYMINGASLIGFTLTNGATLAGAGWNNTGGGVWSSSTNTAISNCVIAGNSAGFYGGGAFEGTLFNCTIVGNSAGSYGGGAGYNSTLYNCTLSGNYSPNGGGAYNTTLYNCTIVNNSATYGGGVGYNTAYNCTIASNYAASDGGGTRGGAYYNCAIIGNSSGGQGGGTSQEATYYNCTVVRNATGDQGGGVFWGTYNNCIIYFNTAPNGSNWAGTVSFTNSCTTTAQVGWATGNITGDPLFIANGTGYGTNHVAGNYRLRNNSPPLNAGTNMLWMTNWWGRIDLDGLRRIDRFSGQVDMGCYERMPSGAMFIIGQ